MNNEQLELRYSDIPQELKDIKRWICYDIVIDETTGESKKVPMNPLTRRRASTTDPLTWSSYDMAIYGCSKFNYYGLGFVLGTDNNGETYFGIDLDNHPDKVTGIQAMTKDEFKKFALEFINTLDSYTELSHSGEGIHIICKGNLPEGARRRNGVSVEMYDSGRFFTMTGKVIKKTSINERTEQVKPLWEKYLNVDTQPVSSTCHSKKEKTSSYETRVSADGELIIEEVENENGNNFDDIELINTIQSSKDGVFFTKLYVYGDMSDYNNDHSSADMALCQKLAFWTACDHDQMDRIFRSSALMRDKWDEYRGKDTYGNLTIENAIKRTVEVYTPKNNEIIISEPNKQEIIKNSDTDLTVENIDENGDIIIHRTFDYTKQYDLTDTGNAERLYDYFGDLFKYNGNNKCFMFWNGRTWIPDTKDYIRKYATEVCNVLIDEIKQDIKKMNKALEGIEDPDIKENITKQYKTKISAKQKNAFRISNKAGKDNMITEFKSLHNVGVLNADFDTDPYLLNTLSGVVDLRTGEISPFNKNRMLSKNTNCEISFEEPTVWIKFLHDILERDTEEETQELMDCIQKCVGYTLSGLTTEQCMFLMYGATGSNGKSTFIEQIKNIMGDYGTTTPVQTLMGNKGNKTTEMMFSLSNLKSRRLVTTGETDENEKLSEPTVKILTGADTITARQLYGSEFEFKPTFKIWMATNNKPVIRGQEYAIWRRLYFFPFERTFSGKSKDITLPAKLKEETPKILGWAVKGFVKYQHDLQEAIVNNYEEKTGLRKPRRVEEALAEYKDEMNIINYLKEQCQSFPNFYTKANRLYEDYVKWCKLCNQRVMTNQKFGKEISKKGFEKVRKSDGYYYSGIKLNDDKKGVTFGEDDD